MTTADYIEVITSEQTEEGDICQKFGFRDEMGGLGYHRIGEIQAVRRVASVVIESMAAGRYEPEIAQTLKRYELTNSMLAIEIAAALLARLGGDCGQAATVMPQAVNRAFRVIDGLAATITSTSSEIVRAAIAGKI